MQCTIKYSYIAQVVPPRCRKPRPERFDDGAVVVSIREVSSEQAPVAILGAQLDFESDTYMEAISYRWFAGRLWADIPVHGCSRRRAVRYPVMPAEMNLITDSAMLSNIDLGVHVGAYEGKDGIAAHLLACSTDWLIIDGQLHRTAGEPMYVAITFGLSNNHGGTSLLVDDHLNPNIKPEAYFSLLEKDQANAYTLAIARNRGDTVKVSTDPGFRFEVLISEAIQWKNPAACAQTSEAA